MFLYACRFDQILCMLQDSSRIGITSHHRTTTGLVFESWTLLSPSWLFDAWRLQTSLSLSIFSWLADTWHFSWTRNEFTFVLPFESWLNRFSYTLTIILWLRIEIIDFSLMSNGPVADSRSIASVTINVTTCSRHGHSAISLTRLDGVGTSKSGWQL